MHSKRSDSVDSATTAVGGKQLSGSSLTELQLRQLRCEEPWHLELRTTFVMLYMQYLQQPGAGFQQIQVLSAASDASASQRYMCVYCIVLIVVHNFKARAGSDFQRLYSIFCSSVHLVSVH